MIVITVSLLFGCSDKVITEEKLTTWETVTESHIHNYFNKLQPEALQVCEINEDNIWMKRNGFNDWNMSVYPITNIYTEPSFKWNHEGDYMNVELYCNHEIFVKSGLASYVKTEHQTFVSSFRMKKYYNQETFELTALNFE